ncbi:RNA-binding transcriptional accessory protein [Mariprofundus sp. EBB-1]|uniref:Tex family protein n=1 Tax=Mariprofundus sp. EBB-1 TaxID=2650971 RepID=UPI000EF20FA7|nr:Tex family protein [Mariprofundus sp. EBB-1]RLL50558.1 RNA-binding transcriptional accessory protein [Mariprofundus sp. EBB-1]
MKIELRIAKELNAREQQVVAAIELLDSGATVPFVARYRKEVTGGLDDTQLRHLEERLRYLRDLETRRSAILKSITEQDKLTPELKKSILAAETMARLEDLYLPYKQKRRTKAQLAREAGLESLATRLLADPNQQPKVAAFAYVDAEKGIESIEAALDGARDILMEMFGEDADLIGRLRDYLYQHAVVTSSVVKSKQEEGAKFADYFDYSEQLKRMPSHRVLALFRGQNEGVLRVKLLEAADIEQSSESGHCETAIANRFRVSNRGRAADQWLLETVSAAWKQKLSKRLESDLFAQLSKKAEEEAVKVFAYNLRDLLLAAPAGQRATMGLDPGLRTGVKVAVVDATGKVLDVATIYPHAPAKRWEEAIAALAVLANKHQVDLVSIGNGTGSRETEALVEELRDRFPQLHLTQVMVSEAGASVYSASALAAKEFPDMDVSLRGAVSIARRLQDPLAELVKIEPKAIGVGQYQHDISQSFLARSLDAVVEDCVNYVGVDVNTASAELLSHVAGLSRSMAENMVRFRDEQGAFKNRQQIIKVKGIGAKSFEQAAGFLRIMNGDNPLDASAVHPEAYPVVEAIVQKAGKSVKELIGNAAFLQQLNAADFANETCGAITVSDILLEFEKPGRDPRPEFRTAKFRSGVNDVRDLRAGMQLEGVVTNVANFGAFVDIGVHQDGLVHISALTNTFVDDPHKVVKAGQVVQVKVLEADVKRKRISLTMRLDDEPEVKIEKTARSEHRDEGQKNARKSDAMARQGKQRSEKSATDGSAAKGRSNKAAANHKAPEKGGSRKGGKHHTNSKSGSKAHSKRPNSAKDQVKQKLDRNKRAPQSALAAAFAKAMAEDS